jgi:predicted O-methyltransferase YrrM
MAFSTASKTYLNRLLGKVNLRLDTLTVERLERHRLDSLCAADNFDKPAFPVLESFRESRAGQVLEWVSRYQDSLAGLAIPSRNAVGYSFDNEYFSSPDAEVLYAMVREFQPHRIVEVGSGHSTKICRQAALDASLKTRIISIDPFPRQEVGTLADEIHRIEVERLQDLEAFKSLAENDILFIDSSHVIKTGNDVVFLYLKVIPELAPGVLIHIHDIFLPYDYPKDWVTVKRWDWNEQYLVQALLMNSNAFDVLWAGYYLQKTRPDFAQIFSSTNRHPAQSLWLRKKANT